MKDRSKCQYRHENGNCLPIGGFCTAVDDKYCIIDKKADDTPKMFGIDISLLYETGTIGNK